VRRHILRAIPASIILFATPSWAAENQSSVSTSLGANARYQIVQSELVARVTFRVDRVCGAVSQIVADERDENSWQAVPMENPPTCVADGRIRYQLFTSGLSVRFTYLMNTDNGATWRLVANSQDNPFWQKLP
jgi:hypothetical protein